MSNAGQLPALDLWINRELSRHYDDALSEPLPDDILSVLDRFDETA